MEALWIPSITETRNLLSDEELKNILKAVCKTGEEFVENFEETEVVWPIAPTKFVCDISEEIQLSKSAKFQAVQLLCKAAEAQFAKIYDEHKELSANRSEEVLKDFLEKSPMMLLMSASIASRHSKRKSYLSLNDMLQCLQSYESLKDRYTPEDAYKCERDMLTAPKLQILNPTPLYFVECLLLMLCARMPSLNVDLLKKHCIHLLECVYSHREDIYDTFYNFVGQNETTREVTNVRKMKADFMLLACGIILGASLFCDSTRYTDIFQNLYKLIHIPYYVMSTFTYAVILSAQPSRKSRRNNKSCKQSIKP